MSLYKIKKYINLILIQLQRRIFKNSYVYGYPYELIIDPSYVCNLNCSLCPSGKKKFDPSFLLTFSTFKKVIDEVGDYLFSIQLHNWGEPFLNQDIFKMISYAKRKKIKVMISTNLNSFNEGMAEKLIKSNLDVLIVSLDGTTQETINKYQQNSNFKKVIDNIKLILAKKKILNKNKPLVQWRFIVMSHNELEIQKAKLLATQLGINKFELADVRCDMAKEVFMQNKEQFENVLPFLPKNEKYSIYDYKYKRKKIIRNNNCSFLWSRAVINYDGSITPCCMVYDLKYRFGNINKETFNDIWNNKSYQDARRIVSKNIISTSSICNICKKNNAML